ncbi:PGAP1-domain-containing protein [Atractiella rhizophila]|nr:PGAP1-domain-containing protein [Atractiella rhizophila]
MGYDKPLPVREIEDGHDPAVVKRSVAKEAAGVSKASFVVSLLSLAVVYLFFSSFVDSLKRPALSQNFLDSFIPPASEHLPNTRNGLQQWQLAARGGTSGTCRMSWSSPSYLSFPEHLFNETHTAFYHKYAVYLYRENGWDPSPPPSRAMSQIGGTPVLFVPGNAGSFKQVRSFASGSSRLLRNRNGEVNEKWKHSGGLDWFTIDFNEDFSAFHGQTMHEQAHYINDAISFILSLYRDSQTSHRVPSSVIVVAHSMGGISSRLALTLPNYIPGSIHTILTVATPHSLLPVTFDPRIEEVYEEIHDVSLIPSTENLTVVSIAGGVWDSMINSDAAFLSSAMFSRGESQPRITGFTVFTTEIPTVYSSIDHLAVLWCDQLRTRIVQALLEISDAFEQEEGSLTPGPTEAVFKRYLKALPDNQAAFSHQHVHIGAEDDIRFLSPEERLSLDLPSLEKTTHHVFRSPSSASTFKVLTSVPIDAFQNVVTVSRCRVLTSHSLEHCHPVSTDRVQTLPRSIGVDGDAQYLPGRSEIEGMWALELPMYELEDYQSWVVTVPKSISAEWIFAGWETQISSKIGYGLFGVHSDILLRKGSVWTDIQLPLSSSLLVFRLQLTSNPPSSYPFSPLLQISTPSTAQSSFFPSPFQLQSTIHTHSNGPFLEPLAEKTLQARLYHTQHQEDQTVPVQITLDYWSTLARIAIRYRTVIVAYPFGVWIFCFAIQLEKFFHGGQFPTITSAFSFFVNQRLPIVLAASTSLSLLQALFFPAATSSRSWVVHDLLTGTLDVQLVWLHPLLVFASVGIFAAYVVCIHIFTLLWMGIYTVCSRLWGLRWMMRILCGSERDTSTFAQRMVSFGFLLAFVVFFAPYQFAFLLLFLLQLLQTSHLYSMKLEQEARFNFALLTMMFLLLPLTSTILLVWTRNLLAGWYAPFSSDHNVLQVLGFLVLLEVSRLKLPPRLQGVPAKFVLWALVLMGCWTFAYAGRFTFGIWTMGNLIVWILSALFVKGTYMLR